MYKFFLCICLSLPVTANAVPDYDAPYEFDMDNLENKDISNKEEVLRFFNYLGSERWIRFFTKEDENCFQRFLTSQRHISVISMGGIINRISGEIRMDGSLAVSYVVNIYYDNVKGSYEKDKFSCKLNHKRNPPPDNKFYP